MGPIVVLFCCFFVLLLIPVFLFLVTHVYRTSCVLCGLPRPTVLNAFGVMLVSWICLLIAEAVMGKLVEVTCDAAGLPRWEAVVIVFFLLFLVTYVFRKSCVLCGLPKPSVMTAFGVMLLIWVSKTVSQAVMEVIVAESCRAAGVPRWEAVVIIFFLFLPIDLVLSSAIHAGLAGIRFGKGIEVWFVQRLIQLGILTAILIVGLVVYLIRALA